MPSNVPATQERLEPFYMGQFGVDGSDVPLGVKTGIGNVIYVGTDDASGLIEPLDTNDGTRWNAPKATIQAALDACVDGQGDMVVILPGNYTITAALTMTNDRVRLYSWDWDRGPYCPSVCIMSTTYDHTLLEVDANQIEIAGIRFANAGADTNACISVANGGSVIGLDIHDCRFSQGLAGILLGTAALAQDFHIHDCYFVQYDDTVGNAGINVVSAWQGLIEGNHFYTDEANTSGISFSVNQVCPDVMVRDNDFDIAVAGGTAINRAGALVNARFHGNRVSGGPTTASAITQTVDGGLCAVENYVSNAVGGALIDATT